MRLLIFTAVVFFNTSSAFGQTPATQAVSGEPRITVVAGLGNAMGIFGAQAERYMRSGRVSVFGGVGYLPQLEPGNPSGMTVAAGARWFTAGQTHRAFLEVSVSPLRSEFITDGATRVSRAIVYGPGVQGGYQFITRGGFTALASIGAGVPVGAESGSGVDPMAGLGLGFTWRR
jgi:hypothetical protein